MYLPTSPPNERTKYTVCPCPLEQYIEEVSDLTPLPFACGFENAQIPVKEGDKGCFVVKVSEWSVMLWKIHLQLGLDRKWRAVFCVDPTSSLYGLCRSDFLTPDFLCSFHHNDYGHWTALSLENEQMFWDSFFFFKKTTTLLLFLGGRLCNSMKKLWCWAVSHSLQCSFIVIGYKT